MAITHQTAKTEFISDGNIKYAYRRFGAPSEVPVVFLMHFRGNIDFWDPKLINAIAAHRTVILFDNAGVGHSTGTVATTGKAMAAHVITFLSLLSITRIDLLGFSLGGVIAPLVYLNGPPNLVRKLIIAGAGVSYGEDVQANTEERIAEVNTRAGQAEPDFDNCFSQLFYYPSATSQALGREAWARIWERNLETSGEEHAQLVSYKYADGGEGVTNLSAVLGGLRDPAQRADGTYDRLGDVKIPVLVAQGKDDFMIPTSQSFLLQQKLPDALLKLYPDSGHGFLYQFAEEFAGDVNRFLDS